MKSLYRLVRQVLSKLPVAARRFLALTSTLLAVLSVFDAVALVLLALVIGPLSAGGEVVLPLFGTLDSVGVMVAILAICLLMIAKGLLSTLVLYWITRRIPRYEVELGDRLLRAYLRAPWVERLKRNSSDMVRLTDSGVDVTFNAFLVPGVTLLGELVSLVIVVAMLAVVQPVIALVTLGYVGLLGLLMFLWMAPHARRAGEANTAATLRTQRIILEMVAALKEVSLRGKEPAIAEIVRTSRRSSSQARANSFFLGQVPRYALEAGLVGGFLLVGAVGLLIGGVEQAILAVALFGLAGFRLAPSVIRAQSIVAQMISVSPYPRFVVDEIESAERSVTESTEGVDVQHLPASPAHLELRDVTFGYAPDGPLAVDGVSLDIPFGSTAAFVGQSGSGKSTMVDLILSLLEPTSGSITVDGIPLRAARTEWRERLAYVPQTVAVFDATIAQNVALTWGDDFDEDRVRVALEQAQLWDFVAAREGGMHSRVSESGLALSGGQRQRLGIARALYSDPLVLILDEATSALDTATEAAVSESIAALAGERTLIVVAHRLATIKDADRVFLMRDGKLAGQGSFDELVRQVPDFAEQAQLAGLV